MIKRAEYGSLKDLSEQEYKEYKAKIAKQWRSDNPDKVKEYNKDWYAWNKKHPKHECFCKICENMFLSYRKSAKICKRCLAKRKKS